MITDHPVQSLWTVPLGQTSHASIAELPVLSL